MTYPRSSPLAGGSEDRGADREDIFGMPVPVRFRGAEEERQTFETLSLCDLSLLPKSGLKGDAAIAWLQGEGIAVPEEIYHWNHLEGGGLCIRVDRSEVFLEDGFDGSTTGDLETRIETAPERTHRVERQDAGFLLAGNRAWEPLRQVCSHDFRDAAGTVVMTRIAAVSCMVLPLPVGGIPAFRIWCLPSYGVYLWENLLQIVTDLGGNAVGIENYRAGIR